MAAKIRVRRGTTAQWAASTRILDSGEIGYDTTAKLIKIGDGTSLWASLENAVLNSTLNSLIATESYLRAQAIGTAKSEAISTAATDATTKANAAQSAAISAAATDATTKATAALTSANLYTDEAVSGLQSASSETYVPISDVGNIDGVASLDATGKIPDTQIPDGIARDSEVTSAISTAIDNLVGGAPGALNTLNELAEAINDDSSYASTITAALGLKAPLASPTFTGTVSGIDKTMVGLGNVDNTSDANKPVSTATQTALDLKADASAITELAQDAVNTAIVAGTGITKVYDDVANTLTVSVDTTAIQSRVTGVTDTEIGYLDGTTSSIQDQINAKSDKLAIISSESTSYTIASTDLGKLIEMSSGGTLTITDSSSFPVGFTLDVLQTGTSQVTIAGDGFTPDATPGLKLRSRWSSATLIKRALNSWVVLGDLSA